MKKIGWILAFVVLGVCLNACKGNDYQHPMHRTGQVSIAI